MNNLVYVVFFCLDELHGFMAKASSRSINAIRCIGAVDNDDEEPLKRLRFGEVFPTQLCVQNIAERIFLKLRELNFQLLGFSEIHLHFYKDSDAGVKCAESDGVHLWKRDVSIAIDPENWVRLDPFEQETLLIKVICLACRYVASKDNFEKISLAGITLLEQRAKLSIKVFEKSIQSYSVIIFCEVPSTEGQVTSHILYRDNKAASSFRADFIQTGYVPELIHLCGLVTVKNGEITVLPRKGHFTSSIAWKYGSPIRFQISDMERVE